MTTNTTTIQQMKLTNGDEIVCEVIGWVDDETNDLAVKSVLKIAEVPSSDPDTIISYVLRPWVMYKHEVTTPIYLNAINIIASTSPCESLEKQFLDAVKELTPSTEKTESDEVVGNVVTFPKK